MSAPSVSVVIPVYNSAATLRDLVARLGTVMPDITPMFEVILVNDGSRDESWSVIEELRPGHAWLRGIDLVKNFGQHNAVLAGIRDARHDVVVTMDDDLQHPPEEIPKLLAELDDGFDVVYGSSAQMQHSFWRNLASRILRLALKASMGIECASRTSAFRAFRTQLRDAFAEYRGSFISIDVLLTWSTHRFTAIDVRQDPRAVGSSNYTIRKLVNQAVNMLTGFSTVPLQLASWIGFAFTIFGVLVLIWVVGRYVIEGESVPGFPFLASIIALFSGAQLFALGVIGEYLARMHFRLLGKPPYVIRSTTEDRTPRRSEDD